MSSDFMELTKMRLREHHFDTLDEWFTGLVAVCENSSEENISVLFSYGFSCVAAEELEKLDDEFPDIDIYYSDEKGSLEFGMCTVTIMRPGGADGKQYLEEPYGVEFKDLYKYYMKWKQHERSGDKNGELFPE